MELFVCVLTDIIHFVKIIIICSMFFFLRRREWGHNRLILPSVGAIAVAMSSVIYFIENPIIDVFIYIMSIIMLMIMLYEEKMYRIIIITLWLLFALSMIHMMTYIMIDIVMELINRNGEMISKLISSFVSLALIYALGRLYRKSETVMLNRMGTVSLFGFTLLLAIDAFVIAVIKTQPFNELYTASQKNLYLVALSFAIIGIFIQLAAVIILFTQRNVYKEKEALTYKYLNEQKSHYEYLENREKETKKFRHDLKSHMEMISSLAKECQYERMNAYLEQMNIRIDDFGNVVTVQNGIVDAIINQYYAKAQSCGVNMEVKGRFPVDCAIDAFDLCTIFSNVLSNALEAAKETEEKYILVECVYTEMTIMIIVSNSYKPDAVNGGGQWKTRKADLDYHGYGLENIKDSVEKYKGGLDIETKDNIFSLRILFSYMEMQNHENSNCG